MKLALEVETVEELSALVALVRGDETVLKVLTDRLETSAAALKDADKAVSPLTEG